MRDLAILIPDPARATLDDLVRSFDAELVDEHVEKRGAFTEHTILVRDRWARERFAIGKLCYPAGEPGPLAYVKTHEGLERARERLIDRLQWTYLDDLRYHSRVGSYAPPGFLAKVRAFLGI